MIPFSLGSFEGAFLLGFPALFSIINPLGSSLIFSQVLAGRSHAERVDLAARVALYSTLVLLVSLWVGSSLLAFFGISIGALRLAGGLVVAHRAWELLNSPAESEAQKEAQATPARLSPDAAFYPLTMPFTTGPGTISVAIALGSARPGGAFTAMLPFMAGMTVAAIGNTLLVWIAYRYADRVVALLGRSGTRVVTRLVAFLLLCIGTQIMVNGAREIALSLR